MIDKRAVLQGDVTVELLAPQQRVKTAGARPAVQAFLDALKPDPTYTYALVNAMGFSEYFGPNSNADWYGFNPHLGFNGLMHAWPDIGRDVVADRMKGKDWPYGYPCFYNAAVYAHHKNTDPAKLGFGDVIFAFANMEMKRIELMMRVHNEEARKKGHLTILERVAGGSRSDVSMGARVPFDTCSICTDWDLYKKALKTFDPKRHRHEGIAVLEYHRKVHPIRGLAVTRDEYCSCMKTNKGKTLPSGDKVFVYNDYPRFFDISFVYIGADRTARVMWHLAQSLGRPVATDPMLGALERFLALGKVATMEKEVPGTVEQVLHDADTSPEFDLGALFPKTTPQQLLSSAASLGIVVTPGEFQALVAPGLDGLFDDRTSGVDAGMAVDPSKVLSGLLPALKHLCGERSSFAPYLEPRLPELPIPKVAQQDRPVRHTDTHAKIAALYNGYRLSVLEKSAALTQRAEGLFIDPLAKVAGAEALAGLLLGAAPVLHLVASHLRRQNDEGKQLGTMAQIVADNPTFLSLATLGAGIRMAMIAEKGGMLAALARLLQAAPKI